jgi:hypothetical protein
VIIDRIKRKFFIVIVVLFCSLCLSGTVVHAGVGASPASFISDLPEAKSFSTTVRNTGDSPINISVIPAGLKLSSEGGVRAQNSQKDLELASKIFRPDPANFILPPQASREVIISVTPPEDAEGGIYGTILVVSEPSELGGSRIINVLRVAIPILFTLPGPSKKNGKVTKIEEVQKEIGAPIEIKVMFRDTGNVHFRVIGRAFIEDQRGKQLAQLSLGKHTVVPTGGDRLFSGNWQPEGLPVGDYTVKVEMQIEDGPTIKSSKIFHVISPDKVLQLGGEISDFSVPKVAKNKPITFGLVFYNKSNIELLPEGEINIKNSDGNIISIVPILAKEKIISKSSGELRAVLEKGLPQGEYIAEAMVSYGLLEYNEMRTAKTQVKFTVLEKIPVIAGEISGFTIDSVKSGEAVVPQLFFRNTGNTEFTVEGLIELKNSAGKTVGQIPINKIKLAEKEEKRLGMIWSGTLPVGLYKAVVTLIYAGDKIITGEASFLVK